MVVQYTQLPRQLVTVKFIYKWVQLVFFSEQKINVSSHYLIISFITNEWLYLLLTLLLFFQIWLKLISQGTAGKKKENRGLCKFLYFFTIPSWRERRKKKKKRMFKSPPVDWFYPHAQKQSNHTVTWQHTKNSAVTESYLEMLPDTIILMSLSLTSASVTLLTFTHSQRPPNIHDWLFRFVCFSSDSWPFW